jgi:hypothetical protein
MPLQVIHICQISPFSATFFYHFGHPCRRYTGKTGRGHHHVCLSRDSNEGCTVVSPDTKVLSRRKQVMSSPSLAVLHLHRLRHTVVLSF